MASAPAVKSARRALVWLIVITAAIAALIGVGFNRGEATLVPKLALDLQGGTQILLAPKNTDGAEVTAEQVEQAVAIIRQRVDSSGVAEAEVGTMGGSNILISIPGKADQATLERIEASARLDLRAVLAVGAGANAVTAEQKQAAGLDTAAADADLYPEPRPSEAGSLEWLTPALIDKFDNFVCSDEALADLGEADPALPLITCDTTGQVKYILAPVEMTGDTIADAGSGLVTTQTGAATGQWAVNISFDAEGTKQFAAISQRLLAQPSPYNQFSFVVDGRVISAPSMNAAILDGNAQITGNFDEQSSALLGDQLKHGALPISFQVQSQEDISATLGVSQLQAGLIAGVIGLLIVVIYSIFQYRGLAILTVTSLLVAALLTYLLLTFFSWRYGYRLSLAGVTGIIVAIGFTADSFIVYFERVRDSLRDGLGLVDAVQQGWKQAFRTILASDTIFFLAAIILFLLAVGNVRGFAFTLGLTTLVDLIVVALFTHPMLTLMARTRFWGQGHPASGLDPRALGVPAKYQGRGKVSSGAPRANKASRKAKAGQTNQTIAERKAAAARENQEG